VQSDDPAHKKADWQQKMRALQVDPSLSKLCINLVEIDGRFAALRATTV
jgi:hypothetical protein